MSGLAIKIGSIVHLKSAYPNGGYLDTQGRVMDYAQFQSQKEKGASVFVFTYGGDIEESLAYSGANRDLKSGSWQIVSREAKPIGEPLVVGDKISLENQYPNVGRLAVMDNLKDIAPFKEPALKGERWQKGLGIFTAHSSSASSSWIVRSTTKADGEAIHSLDEIWLENESVSNAALEIYPDEKVTSRAPFKTWEGQQFYVFANPEPNAEASARSWKIILSHLSHNIFHVETKPNAESVIWDSEGIFEVGGRSERPFKFFNAELSETEQELEGEVTYFNNDKVRFKAVLSSDNSYDVSLSDDDGVTWQEDGQWRLGTPTKKIKKMDIVTGDGGYSFEGTMQFVGTGGPLRVRGKKAKPQETAVTSPNQPLPDHANSMRVVMDSTNSLLRKELITLLGGKNRGQLQKILQAKNAPGRHNVDLMDELEEMVKTHPAVTGSPEEADFWLQAKQLIKLYILSQDLNRFLLKKLPTLVADEPFHRVRKILRLAAADHEMLQRATLQRRWNRHVDGKVYVSDHAQRVLLMDKLAMMSVVPLQSLVLKEPEQLRVITYFSTKTHIHHIPYDDQDGRFLLVGVSYDYDRVSPISSEISQAASSAKKARSLELMAIPHEVGHYIFRYAHLNPQETHNQLAALGQKAACTTLADLNLNALLEEAATPITLTELNQTLFHNNPYHHWCEEIFADMYGCVIAGAPTLLGMQAMLGSTDTDLAWTDDAVHPTPVFRPYILSEMLRILHELDPKHYPYPPSLIQVLDQDWTAAIGRWGYERIDTASSPAETKAKAHASRPDFIKFRNKETHAHLEQMVNIKKVIENVCPILYTYAQILISNADFGDGKTGDDGQLPTQIPWQHGQDKMVKRQDYYDEIEELTNSYIVGKAVETRVSSGYKLAGDVRKPKSKLQEYIDHWDKSGPHGWGGH